MRELQLLGDVSGFVLIVYHFAFFWKFYKNPFLCSTSEVLSSYFPYWIYAKGNVKFKDEVYYEYPASTPVISPWYFPSNLVRKCIGWLSMDWKFRIFVFQMLLHYLLGSYLAYFALLQFFGTTVALFGAITLVYNAYNIRLQTPCFSYTSCWLMGVLLPFPLGAICFGMAILGGYFPIILVFLPVLLFNPSSLLGLLMGLPQLIPFFWYYPKSIRASTKPSSSWGRMPLKRFFLCSRFPENGMIHYPEYAWKMGLASILWVFYPSWWWVLIVYAFIGTQGFPLLARIPARFLYLLGYATLLGSLHAIGAHYSTFLGWGAIIPILVIQMFIMWQNRDQYPSFPFSQWWRRPSFWFSRYVKSDRWPYFTGYMWGVRHGIYRGGMRLKEYDAEE